MSAAAEDQVNQDIPQGEENEDEIESQYRSYREEAKKKGKARQKFPLGRAVWFKTATNGAYMMTVAESSYNPGANNWSYRLKDSAGVEQDEWVAETALTAARPEE